MTAAASLEPTRPQAGELEPDDYLRERYRRPATRRRTLNAYYLLKPLVPRRIHLAARRAFARTVRPTFPRWPIEPILVEHQHALWRRELAARAGGPLPIVNLWPDAHRFALTVTHDVESPKGVANIEAVLEVERRHGIVSSWNFVAEWYPIPDGTFERVRAAGGEVGLHGVRHDGLLFRDRASFDDRLPRIHRHLAEWGAVGFRSPATHRNADWMPELGCLYDSSFPDTDPYEPQPGGCCSIFPYFLGDLVELPITMVQDHTMWEILRRRDMTLWREKGDWIAANHGLVNVIVHPDYVLSADRLDLYSQLLAYLRGLADGQGGWHALPRDVAAWWKARARMSAGPERITGDGEHAAAWLPRATTALVSDRDGRIRIDV